MTMKFPMLTALSLAGLTTLNCVAAFAASVSITYGVEPGSRQLAELVEEGALEDGVKFVNTAFDLERDIKILIGAEEGPLYDPATSEIHIPYAFYDEVLQRISQLEPDKTERATFVNDAMLHTLYHELGHALIDQFDLPVVGKEEDAVDSLATMMLLEYYEDGADMAANAAELFALESEDRGELEDADFWDEHSLDEQRYYGTLCHVVGSDPTGYAELADEIGFSEDRVAICESSYLQMVEDWHYLLDEIFDPQ